jgi:hypothetical protein
MEAGPRDRPQPDHGQGQDTSGELPELVVDGPLDAPLGGPLIGSLDGALDVSLGEEPEGGLEDPDGQESFRELRPQRRLRIWQLAPIVALATVGSLMFAFPLAFEFGDGGAVVAMLGFLLCCCSAGWAVMAARRVGHTWPGLPARGSGRRPDWRFVLLYFVITALLAVLAFWRVARLR